ncbi:hypothetical protein M3Y97_00033000 [Aphelenchoides bicaudatus]|nr:hypothetical protein M3Y97_00033000 [Aphelenchoides bicaudatus]
MNKTLLCVLFISTILFVDACFDAGQSRSDGEEWEAGGVRKRCKLYKPGQGIIETIGGGSAASAGDAYGGGSAGSASVASGGPRLAVYDGKTYQNTDAELNPLA